MSTLHVAVARPAARLGLKGPDAAALLQQAGVPVPAAANRILTGAVRVLRLGNTEFIVEQDDGDATISAVRNLARGAGLRAWPVLRADCSLILRGEALFEQLARVCAFDFAQLAAQPDMAVMTLLADISVTFALEPTDAGAAPGSPALRLWADPGFATYLVQTLRSLNPDAPGHGVHA